MRCGIVLGLIRNLFILKDKLMKNFNKLIFLTFFIFSFGCFGPTAGEQAGARILEAKYQRNRELNLNKERYLNESITHREYLRNIDKINSSYDYATASDREAVRAEYEFNKAWDKAMYDGVKASNDYLQSTGQKSYVDPNYFQKQYHNTYQELP